MVLEINKELCAERIYFVSDPWALQFTTCDILNWLANKFVLEDVLVLYGCILNMLKYFQVCNSHINYIPVGLEL